MSSIDTTAIVNALRAIVTEHQGGLCLDHRRPTSISDAVKRHSSLKARPRENFLDTIPNQSRRCSFSASSSGAGGAT
jgi:hypothetical protein